MVRTIGLNRFLLCSSLLATISVAAPAMTHTRRGPTAPRFFSKKSKVVKTSGQRAIDSERATEIQSALIKQGYLAGEASGHWDAETESAMQKLQADNGWQTKLVPDSRAIIKLGLGANHEAEQATTAGGDSLNR